MVKRTTTNVDDSQIFDQAAVEELLVGAIDLHCHSGPSVMPRDLDHLDAARAAAEVGMRAILFKDHYYSAAPVTALLNRHFRGLKVEMLSGVPLNNTVGGLNRYAVDHGIKLGARIVWMPTFSAANHIAHHQNDPEFHKRFPTPHDRMLAPTPLTVLNANGTLVDEVKAILDLIAEADIVLSAGHLHISEIWPLFEEVRNRGVHRFLVNHPSFPVDASLEDMAQLAHEGVYLEHSMCMFVVYVRRRIEVPVLRMGPPGCYDPRCEGRLHDSGVGSRAER